MLPGIGIPELIVLFILLLMIGVPIVAVIVVIVYLIRNQGSSRVAELEAENERLRQQLRQHGLL